MLHYEDDDAVIGIAYEDDVIEGLAYEDDVVFEATATGRTHTLVINAGAIPFVGFGYFLDNRRFGSIQSGGLVTLPNGTTGHIRVAITTQFSPRNEPRFTLGMTTIAGGRFSSNQVAINQYPDRVSIGTLTGAITTARGVSGFPLYDLRPGFRQNTRYTINLIWD